MTDKGRSDLIDISAAVQAMDQRATANLSADEVVQLNQLLTRVMASAHQAANP
jgi:DNA-binding MarR family transcriptional regulator